MDTINNFLIHCGKKTKVTNSRNVIRIRVCQVCGERFKTEEIQIDFYKTSKRHRLVGCPVNKAALERMMEEYPSLKMIANDLHVSTGTLNRWLREYDL